MARVQLLRLFFRSTDIRQETRHNLRHEKVPRPVPCNSSLTNSVLQQSYQVEIAAIKQEAGW